MRLKLRHFALAALAMFTLASNSFAQDYPTRPVKIIVGFVAGGGPDIVARALSIKLQEILGQPFVVDNRPGAGGTLGGAVLAKSPADGYTLMVGETGPLAIAPFVYKAIPYDTLKDFAPVALVTSEPVLLVSSTKSNIKTLQDLVREAKANPGRISYGSSGIGTIHHIVGEAFKAGVGIDMQHVPYKGSGQSVPAILAGDVPVLVTSFGGAGAHIRSGALNLLAVSSASRVPLAPDTPSLSETIKGYDFQSEIGLLAPAGVPPTIVAKLAAAVKQASESPDFIARFKDTATVVTYKGPADYVENLKTSLRKYEQAVKLANIQPE